MNYPKNNGNNEGRQERKEKNRSKSRPEVSIIFEGIKNQKGGQNNCRRENRAFYKPVEVIFPFVFLNTHQKRKNG